MKITDRRTKVTRSEVIQISDGEVRPVPYSRAARSYRVDAFTVAWSSTDDMHWVSSTPALSGVVLKKDGSDSQNRTEERLYGHLTPPDWVRELLADTDPSGGAA